MKADKNNLVPIIRKAQAGDSSSMNKLMKKFDPIIKSNARYGRNYVDKDEYQRLWIIAFVMIQTFELDRFLNGGNH